MKITYEVNEKKRTITCIIGYNLKSYELDKAVGVAYCSPDDTWNEDLGRLIAGARAQLAMHEAIAKGTQDWINRYNATINQELDTLNRHQKIIANYRDRLKKLKHGEIPPVRKNKLVEK